MTNPYVAGVSAGADLYSAFNQRKSDKEANKIARAALESYRAPYVPSLPYLNNILRNAESLHGAGLLAPRPYGGPRVAGLGAFTDKGAKGIAGLIDNGLLGKKHIPVVDRLIDPKPVLRKCGVLAFHLFSERCAAIWRIQPV